MQSYDIFCKHSVSFLLIFMDAFLIFRFFTNRGGNLQKLTKRMFFFFDFVVKISNVVAVFAFWFLKELNANLIYVKYIHAFYGIDLCQKRISWKKATLFP